MLAQYLHADPTREDFAAALADVELGDEAVIAAVWKLVEDHQLGRRAQPAPRQRHSDSKARGVSHADYGSRIGITWAPAGWTLDLDGMTAADLEAAVEMARAEHERAIGAAAVSAAAREQIKQAEAGSLMRARILARR